MSNHIAAKSLTIRVCAAVLSLLLLTLSSCAPGYSPPSGGGEDLFTQATAEAEREMESEIETHEVETAIAGIATYEASATSEAEATEPAATVAAQATATAAPEATERPVPSGKCTTAGASCLVEGKFMLELYYDKDSILENWVDIVFPVDGGAVSGDYRFSLRVGMAGAEGCLMLHEYPGTLSGNYDPASGHMEGAVHGGKGTWTVLEGCEDITVTDIGTYVSWSAWYDAVTGHVAGEIAVPDEEEEEGLPFEGSARSELDTE